MFEPGARVQVGGYLGTVTDSTSKAAGVALDNGRSLRIDPALLLPAEPEAKALDRAPADKAVRRAQTKGA